MCAVGQTASPRRAVGTLRTPRDARYQHATRSGIALAAQQTLCCAVAGLLYALPRRGARASRASKELERAAFAGTRDEQAPGK